MSVQFGRWNFGGKPVDPVYREKVEGTMGPYGPDDHGCLLDEGVLILYRAFHTTEESERERQPHITEFGSVLVWDGRLDNRAELIGHIADRLSIPSTDVSIVSAAYEKWGIGCFGKLIGDWAISIWNPRSRSLLLAKDPIGTRHLYYAVDEGRVTWATILDPLVLFAEKSFALSEEYIAGWLSFFPATHLTAFHRILSVPPASFVSVRPENCTVSTYWNFDGGKKFNYRNDTEYEQHFRSVFATAVQRRLRSDRPVLAELSGGRDSSSIVCMADALLAQALAETSRLDTVSYYDDTEPNWDERPYFRKVEAKRRQTGCHIDISSAFEFCWKGDAFAASPASLEWRGSESRRRLAACMAAQGNRVLLSGIGGDEVTGGVPTVEPELQDLLVTAQVKALARQLKLWALNRKKPWFHLFFESLRSIFPSALVGIPKQKRPPLWINPTFRKHNYAALEGYETRVKVFGPRPSFQENLSTLSSLQRQLSCTPLTHQPPYEKRYPYLDRDLLEFLFAIPREQLVRPGFSRSLMRRALAGIVPDEILNRKRKAFSVRTPRLALAKICSSFIEPSQPMLSSSLGIIDQKVFLEALQRFEKGAEESVVGFLRTVAMECWLRSQKNLNFLNGFEARTNQRRLTCLTRMNQN